MVTDKSDLTWQWGNYITLRTEEGEQIIYAHLSKRLVFAGDRVKAGEVIGIEGNTGYSFGSHCHLEVRNKNGKVTKEVNTPVFTEIPNRTGKYKVKEEEDLTREEVLKLIEESKERVWHYWDEIKKEAPWAYAPLKALYENGYFTGASASDLKITQTKLESLVVLARALEGAGIISF